MKILIPASALFLLIATSARSQVPTPCVLTRVEQQQADRTEARVASPPPQQAPVKPDPEFNGCGIWRFNIDETGKVLSVELVRKSAGSAYEARAKDLLIGFRFTPQTTPWTGLMRFWIRD